ncbi:MAG: cupin domain-containing protein [Lautropia sp.]|nr:cupin domain-containing protein [Lautropia sp.]
MSGTFQLGHGDKFDDSKLTALPTGSVAIMQPKSPHFATVKEETIVQLHGIGPWSVVYVNPADDPSKKH